MSCYWNIECLDCGGIHRFCDANHMDAEMAILANHADVIAALLPLQQTLDIRGCGLRLGFDYEGYGKIDIEWFAKHRGHRLMPIDEYGRRLEDCAEYVICACGSPRRCQLKLGHEGGHDSTARR